MYNLYIIYICIYIIYICMYIYIFFFYLYTHTHIHTHTHTTSSHPCSSLISRFQPTEPPTTPLYSTHNTPKSVAQLVNISTIVILTLYLDQYSYCISIIIIILDSVVVIVSLPRSLSLSLMTYQIYPVL